ncbi:hypothetical protein ACH5RR_001114 [Cinchona calisaya]|uniref:Uncharacterized protein n=1 Tax=Cinchona calisaya TaxID=153742 RepID=A0ABD3B354_9GENT
MHYLKMGHYEDGCLIKNPPTTENLKLIDTTPTVKNSQVKIAKDNGAQPKWIPKLSLLVASSGSSLVAHEKETSLTYSQDSIEILNMPFETIDLILLEDLNPSIEKIGVSTS